ncbi:MAG: O-antigen ligase family protein [Candidatus Sungbacteria bacterium]|nr:O-antigen ligase family protein [Candidatus Sungbacteria bacterium]
MKFLFWFLIGIVVSIPLVSWDGFMFAATFTKTMLFQAGVEIALVIWFWQGGLKQLKQISQPRSFLFLALLIWLAAMLISSLVAYDPQAAWWSGYERMMGMVVWLHLFIFLFLLVTIFSGEQQWKKLFTAIALSGVAVALIGIGEKFFGSDIYSNIESTLFNSAFLGSFLVLIFFIIVRQLTHRERFNWEAVGWLLALLIVFLATLFTEARSALVGIFGGGFMATALIAWRGVAKPIMHIPPRWIRRVAFLFIIFIVAAAGATFLLRDTLKNSSLILLSRIGNTFSEDRTGSGRLLAWQVGWHAFKERPVFGWGIENFSFAFNAYYDPRLFNVEPWFDRGHNLFVDWGVTTGIIGLFCYLGVMGGSFWALARRRELALVGLLAAAFAQNVFTFDILPTYIILFVVFAYIIASDRPTFNVAPTLNVGHARGIVGLVLLIPIFYFVMWNPLRENIIAKAAGEALAEGKDEQGYQLIEKALVYKTYGDSEARRLVAEYVFEFIKKGGKRNPEAMTALYDFALTQMEENTKARPRDTKWPAYGAALGNLAYAHTGKIAYAERAAAYAHESLALSPGRQQHWLELAQALLAQKKEKEYFEAMDTAIALLPRYPIPHLNAAVGAITLGVRDQEEREIAWLRTQTWDSAESERDSWDNPIRDWEALVQAYYKTRRLSDAIVYQARLVEERKQTEPKEKFMRDLIQLAALYKEAGRFKEARKTAQEIVAIDPAAAGEAETFLRSLELK